MFSKKILTAGLAALLPACAPSIKQDSSALPSHRSLNSSFNGPFVTDIAADTSLITFLDKSKNLISFDSRAIDMSLTSGSEHIAFCREQLEIFGFRHSTTADDLTLVKSGNTLQFQKVRTGELQDVVSIGRNSAVSILCCSAQINDQESKHGLLFISGRSEPLNCIFCYEDSSGKIISDRAADIRFPEQFKSAVAWHLSSVQKMFNEAANQSGQMHPELANELRKLNSQNL